MKLECSKDKLVRLISKAEKITSKNATLPVLSCIILETKDSNLIIKATNLDLGIEMKVPVKVSTEGIVAVPGNLLLSYLSNISNEEVVTLESVNNNLLITSPKHETQIKALSHEDFPSIPKLSDDKKCLIYSDDLVNGLKSVWYSASVSSMKPELSSVFLYPDGNNLNFVATDSFRLAEKKIGVKKGDDFESVLIPYRNVSEVIRIFDDVKTEILISFDNNQVAFQIDGIYLVSRIVDGNFPDYKQIIPKENTTEVVVLKQDLAQALKLSNIFSDKFNKVTFTVKPDDDLFEIMSKNLDKGENRNSINSTLRGDGLEISFNHKYITDCFNSIDSDSFTLYFNGNNKPMIIKGVNDASFMYLVMPMNK